MRFDPSFWPHFIRLRHFNHYLLIRINHNLVRFLTSVQQSPLSFKSWPWSFHFRNRSSLRISWYILLTYTFNLAETIGVYRLIDVVICANHQFSILFCDLLILRNPSHDLCFGVIICHHFLRLFWLNNSLSLIFLLVVELCLSTHLHMLISVPYRFL